MTVSSPVAAPAATIGRRVGAFAIDLAIAHVLGAVLIGIMAGVAFGAGADPVGLAVLVSAGPLVIGLALLAWWLVYSAMQGGRGSIGQRCRSCCAWAWACAKCLRRSW